MTKETHVMSCSHRVTRHNQVSSKCHHLLVRRGHATQPGILDVSSSSRNNKELLTSLTISSWTRQSSIERHSRIREQSLKHFFVVSAPIYSDAPSSSRTVDFSGIQLTFNSASILSDVFNIEWGLWKLVFSECDLDEHVRPISFNLKDVVSVGYCHPEILLRGRLALSSHCPPPPCALLTCC